MKPEPLKGKGDLIGSDLYEGKDIRSAIEWLTEKNHRIWCDLLDGKINILTASQRIGNNTKEAFKDVME